MFLDQAEFRAERRQDIKMRDWDAFLDKFLRDTELPVLPGAGSVSREEANAWAEQQYGAFVERRLVEAEAEAEARYVDDLRTSANKLEKERRQLTPPKKSKLAKKKNKRGL